MSDAVRLSPSARLLAAEKGIDLASIRGTGPNGRIVRADIDAASEGAPPPPPASAPVAAATQSSSDDRIKASPLAKRIAAEKGIDLALLTGTGPNGRIVKEDVEAFSGAGRSPGPAVRASP